jgi:hypothetical protein
MQCGIPPCIPDSHPHIISTKRRKNKFVSPDDGHMVFWNVKRFLNILRINCAQSWLYLQDYTGIYGHQNIKSTRKTWIIKALHFPDASQQTSLYIFNFFLTEDTHILTPLNWKYSLLKCVNSWLCDLPLTTRMFMHTCNYRTRPLLLGFCYTPSSLKLRRNSDRTKQQPPQYRDLSDFSHTLCSLNNIYIGVYDRSKPHAQE